MMRESGVAPVGDNDERETSSAEDKRPLQQRLSRTLPYRNDPEIYKRSRAIVSKLNITLRALDPLPVFHEAN